MRKPLTISGIAVAFMVLLSACGDGSSHDSMPGTDSSSSAPTTSGQRAGHNADDVAFAQQMIPHHSQALAMAKLVPSRSADPKLINLAGRIEKTQDPEIRQMQGWLTSWGATSAMPGMTTSSMPGGSMPGLMSATDMEKLGQAKGTEFDKMWLDMMIKHHQGAVDMAGTELAKGADTDAKVLARKITDAQQAEITEMQGLLSQS